MNEATRTHVEELVAMPFRTFPDVCVAWKEESGEDFSEVAPLKCPVHQYAMQKGRCLDVTGYTELCRTAWIRFHASPGTCRRYPVGMPRKNRSTKTGIGTASPARRCSESEVRLDMSSGMRMTPESILRRLNNRKNHLKRHSGIERMRNIGWHNRNLSGLDNDLLATDVDLCLSVENLHHGVSWC